MIARICSAAWIEFDATWTHPGRSRELTSLAFLGGGLNMGQVIGQSDRQASEPTTNPYGPEHLLATILHVLFDIGTLRLDSSLPRELTRLADEHPPIEPLL